VKHALVLLQTQQESIFEIPDSILGFFACARDHGV
jgi:hypothetical protein